MERSLAGKAAIAIMLAGLGLLYPLQSFIDRNASPDVLREEILYFPSGDTIRRMAVGLDALAADIYWIRTIQYFGRKVIDSGKPLSTDVHDIDMPLLTALLDIDVTLDPHRIPTYRFAAIFLPERNFQAATALLERGVRDNPDEWRLYQDLGYIYWQAGDYQKAADWYERGGQVPGAMWWMRDMAGVMRIKGGSRDTARAVYSGYMTSDDPNIRDRAIARLKQLKSLDEIDLLNGLIGEYKEKKGTCPAVLKDILPRLRGTNIGMNDESAPVDPDGFPYVLDLSECKVKLNPDSRIAR